jgi:hypothetical protein
VPRVARLLVALAAFAALLPAAAFGQVLYKWVDADGRTQYSDHPPKNAAGPVTRIEPDAPATPGAPAPKAAPAAVPAKAAAPSADDPLTKRRAVRSALEQRLAAARANLEAARRALADTSSPEPDERQVIQQQQQPGAGGMHGLSKSRSNCRPMVDKNGKAGVMCPAVMPNEAYFDRIAKLEEAVRKAEEEVADAESAYRRGAD